MKTDEAETGEGAAARTTGPFPGVGPRRRWLVLAAGFLVLYASYGVQFCFGLFLPEVEKALAPGNRGLVSLLFALYLLLSSLFSLASGAATDRWGPRPVLACGGALLGLGLLGFSRSQELWQGYLSHGLVASLGMSTTWVPVTSLAVRWFPDRPGLASGLVTTGVGVGQLTVPPLSAVALVPLGWRTAYLIYGLALLAAFALASLLVQRPPREVTTAATADGGDDSYTLAEALRLPAFWLFTAGLTVLWSVVYVPVVHLPPFAHDSLGLSPRAASLTMTMVAIGSILSRVVGGAFADVAGHRRALALAVLAEALGFLGMWACAWTGNVPLLYGSAVLFGVGYGSVAGLYAAVLAHLFGRRWAGSISGVAFACAAGTASMGVFVAGLIYQASGGYGGAFALGMALAFLSLPLFLSLRRPERPPARAEVA